MSLAEVGRYDRMEAYIIVGRLESEGIPAVAFDAGASIADGSRLLIPTRVMVDEDDVEEARRILATPALCASGLPVFRAASPQCTSFNR